jgi:hypothetical protein
VLDQRQWEERQAQSEMDNEWRHTVLRSDLAQQKFNNEMTERSQVLAERGFDDRHQAHTQAMKQANLNYDIAKETLAFDRERRPLMLEDQQVKLENAQLDNQRVKNQLEKELWETESTGLDVSYLDPEDYNDVTIGMINERLAGQGMSLTPDGKFMSADGTEVSMPRYMQGEVHKIVVASALLNDKTKEKVMNKVLGIQAEAQKISDEMSTIKSYEDGGLGRVRIASLKRQLATKVAEAKKEAAFFSPKNQIDNLLQQANMMEKAATEMSTDKNNALYVESLFESAKRKRQEAQEISDIELAKMKAQGEGTKVPGQMTEDQALKNVRSGYLKQNALGEYISDPKMSPKLRTMEAAYQGLDQGDPAKRADTVAFVRETTERIEDVYWDSLKKYNEMSVTEMTPIWRKYVEKGMVKKKRQIESPPNRATMLSDMKEGRFQWFVKEMQRMSGNPNLYVYKPKQATRRQNLGGTQGD